MKRLSSLNLLYFLVGIYLVTLIVGGFKFFSSVPFWDMWNGGLEWHLDFAKNGWTSLFSQHNEHRIVLTRLLFEIEYLFGGGTGKFLIALNYALIVSVAGVLFYFVSKSQNPNVIQTKAWLNPVLILITCSWAQHENLNWTFQSQFILVYLLPLMSFIWMQRYLETGRTSSMVLGLLMGELSVWTMANGQLALFVIGVLLLIRAPKQVAGYLAIALGVLSSFLYFIGYQSVAAHGSPINNVLQNPVAFVQYICAYLGNPVFHLMGGNMASALAAGITGLVVALTAAWALFKYFVFLPKDFSLFAIASMLVFIFLTTAATAAGRVGFGVEQAFASRYSTPVLISYALLLILICGLGAFETSRMPVVSWFVIASVVFQFHIFVDEPNDTRDRRTAAMAISLNIEDKEETGRVFPSDTNYLWKIAKRASDAGITMFSSQPLSGYLRANPARLEGSTSCILHVDEVQALANDKEYLKVRGWVSGLPSTQSFGIGEVFEPSGAALGLANIGYNRPDLLAAKVGVSENSGTVAYVKATYQPQVGQELPCRFN